MRAQTVLPLAALLGTTLISSLGSAHIGLSAPLARAQAPSQGNVKSAPCGQTTDGRTSGVSVFQAGQVVTVKWVEYVNHPSYFRVAFQPNGDTFPMRADVPQANNVPETAAEQLSAEQAVFVGSTAQLLAVVQDNNTSTTAQLTTQVTLPEVPCENCTLQVVQVMYNNPPQDGGGYYQCADIAIQSNGDTTTAGNGSTGSTDGPAAGEPDAGTGSAQNGDDSPAGVPDAGAGSATGSGADRTPPAGAPNASATPSSAVTEMGATASGSSPGNAAASSAPLPSGAAPVTSESSGKDSGGCSLGMNTPSGEHVSVALLAGLAWAIRRRRAH